MVRFDLTLEDADPIDQRRRLFADGARGTPLEQPRAELALLGPGQADHVLRIISRALDQGQRLEN